MLVKVATGVVTKPLPYPVMSKHAKSPLHVYEYISVKFESKYQILIYKKCIWKYHRWNDISIVP